MVSVQHMLDQCPHRTTIVFSNLGRWPDRVTGRHKIISRGSFPVSPSLGGVSASKYGCLPFGSHALHMTDGRVRDLVEVVGRLGNELRREPTLECAVSPTLETGFETRVECSHQRALAHGMPSDVLEHI
ncbi:hypothetical protein TNCV_2368371 [Trichonephila clavipes]|nr:hypothetical protein TNCV_2368371 [Trichonephila clavipes]